MKRIAALVSVVGGITGQAMAIPAFPGANGPGGSATGGRGGDVYHVTNLRFDSVPGSLKYGIDSASGPRTIVFDVGGTIFQNGGGTNSWFRSGKSNITIAGQTAPGAGITIAGVGTKWTGSNVVLRNITVRTNKDPVNPSSYSYDAFSLQLQSSIVDHVSASWYSDEGISSTDAGANSTVQYATIGEGLNYAGHAFGSIISTEVDGSHVQYDHNLYAHNASRLPAIGSETGTIGAVLNFSNNVIYNWQQTKAGYSATDQHSSSNFIGNYYIKGANNGVLVFTGGDDDTSVGFTKFFQNKNDPVLANKSDYTRDGVVSGVAFGPGDVMPNGQKFYSGNMEFVSTPFAINGAQPIESADVGLSRVLAYGGANWQNRNPIEQRIINGVTANTGNIIADLSGATQSAEWATVLAQRADAGGVAPFVRESNFDTDADGMPDSWETAHGLSPSAASNNGDFDSDGYTNLEEYLNELAAWPSGKTLTFTNASSNGKYEQISNWGNFWQPSRFDSAQINAGSVNVTSPGQTARNLSIAAGPASTATLSVSSGWIDIRETLAVGAGGTGTLNQSGGAVRAGTSVLIGNVAAPGTYHLSGGTLATPLLGLGNVASTFQFTGGVLRADVVAFSLTNLGGTIAPGSDATLQSIAIASMRDINGNVEAVRSAIGTTQIAGDLLLQGGRVEIQLAGASPSNGFDMLAVMGSASLGGTLELALIGDYAPASLVPHQIVAAGSLSGVFSSVSGLALPANRALAVTYDSTGVWVTATLVGDTNVDGTVSFDDLLLLAQHYEQGGQSWSSGDFSGDGLVDFADLLGLAQNYESGVSSLQADWALARSLAPEPTVAVSLVAVCGTLAGRTRRSRSRMTIPH